MFCRQEAVFKANKSCSAHNPGVWSGLSVGRNGELSCKVPPVPPSLPLPFVVPLARHHPAGSQDAQRGPPRARVRIAWGFPLSTQAQHLTLCPSGGAQESGDPLWSCWEVAHQKEVWRGSDTQVRVQPWESVGSLPSCLQRYWGVCRHQLQGPVRFCGLVCPRSCAAGAQTHFWSGRTPDLSSDLYHLLSSFMALASQGHLFPLIE